MKPISVPLSLILLSLGAPAALAQAHWPAWRGPLGTGEARDANPPTEWSDDENIRWKIEIPGHGKGTPIIWGEHLFVLSAEAFGEELEQPQEEQSGRRGGFMAMVKPTRKQRFIVMAIDRKDGSVVWDAVANEHLPHESTHKDGSWAAASAVTDGEILIASFGSRGIFAYDMQGEALWETQLGEMRTRKGFGEGSTPALFGDTVVVQWDHEGPSFIVGLDARTGEEKWRDERDEPTSWATPLVVVVDGEPQVIANGTNAIRSYDLASGELLWECGGMTTNAIPSPVHRGQQAFLMSGFRGSAALAIDLDSAAGDITESESVLWSFGKDTPYVSSPLLLGDQLYFLKLNAGILSSLDVETGELVFGPTRLETIANVYASPVGAGGHIYLVGRDGETEVIAAGSEYEPLATNVLSDTFDASPAIAENELYLRGTKYLYCIAED